MVLIGLILVALVSLALGLVLASAPWLIVSLVASVVAAVWLWRRRDDIAPATAGGSSGRRESRADRRAAAAPEVAEPHAATSPGVVAEAQPGDVWVIDGKPEYHATGCARLTDQAEPIPFEQAVEDGFLACPDCEPERARSQPAIPAGAPAQVWVIDGRPEYHLPGCGELTDDAEAIPLEQAVEDGFRPCVACEPDRAGERVSATVPDGALTEVWVIDGRPDYHLPGCSELTDAAEVVPYQQAVEDGFTPCATCDPERLRQAEPVSAAPEPEPVAAAPEPEPIEPETEPEAEPEPAAAAPEPEPEPVAPVPETEREPIAPEPIAPEPVAEPEPIAAAPEAEPIAAAAPEPEPEPLAAGAAEPEAAAEAEPQGHGDVWVVAGRQRYHAADCVIITGQDAVAIPYEQAVGDGFKACSLCEPG